MKKSLMRSLFLLSCLFFFSNLEVSAQTYRDVVDIKSDVPSLLTSLDAEHQNLDKNNPSYVNDTQVIKWKYKSLELINDDLGTYSHEDILKISLMHIAEQGVTEAQFATKTFEPESQELYNYLLAFVTE